MHGLALPRLRFEQALALEDATRRLGPTLAAVPHGDLSERVEDPLPFPVVVGVVVARASVRASQEARARVTRLDHRRCERAARAFAAARPNVDRCLAAAGLSAGGAPALYLLAAGPLASAHLKARAARATVHEALAGGETGDARRELAVTWDAAPDPLAIELRGAFALAARYD
jgi:hypothetical protein